MSWSTCPAGRPPGLGVPLCRGNLTRICLMAAAGAVWWMSGPPAQATPYQWFTDQSSFLAALDPGSFTATGAALAFPGGADVPNPKALSGGTAGFTYGFQVTAAGGLYGNPAPNSGIQPLEFNTPLAFQTLTPTNGVTAFGGLFSLRDELELRQAGSLNLELFTAGGSQSIASQSLSVTGSGPSFLGLITYGGTQPITSVTLTAATNPGTLLPTAEQAIVGVPEPSTGAAFLTATGILGVAFCLRRRAGRIVAIGIALAIVGMDVATIAADQPPAPAATETTKKPIDQANVLRAEKKFAEALEILRQATRAVKQSAGDEAPDLLPIYELATVVLIETDEVEKAAALLDKSLALHATLLEAAGGSDPQLTPSYARALLLQGRLHELNGRVSPAVESAAQAARLLDAAAGSTAADLPRAVTQLMAAVGGVADLLGPDHESAKQAFLLAAETLESLGRSLEAAKLRAERLAAVRESLGPADLLAEACQIARLRLAAGQAAEAVADMEAAVAAAPPETPGYPAALRTLGEIHLAAEHFTEAQQAYLRAADIDSAGNGPDHHVAASDRLRAAMVGYACGRSAAPGAELDALVAALPAEPAAGDAAAVDVIGSLHAAADAALLLGRHEQAHDLGNRGLTLAEACPQVPAAERTAFAIVAARSLASGGEDRAAALESALTEANEILGPSHPQTQAAVLALAECVVTKSPADARPLVERLLASGAATPGSDGDERLVRLIEQVGATPPSDPPGPDAAAWGQQLLRLRRNQWGEDHPKVATTCLLVAAGRLAAGDVDAAISLSREALALQEKALGKDHPEVAASLLVAGDALRCGGRFDEAVAAIERSLSIWTAAAGSGHEATLAAVRSLAAVRLAQNHGAEALPLLERLLAADTDGATIQPARRARLLVVMASVLATTDRAERSRRCLDEALKLPCFGPASGASDLAVRELALIMAEAARVLTLLDDAPAASEAVRTARGLAIGMESPRGTLAAIDEIASGTRPLPPGRL